MRSQVKASWTKRKSSIPFRSVTPRTPPYTDTSLSLCLLSGFGEFSLGSGQANPPQFKTIRVYAQKEIRFMQVFMNKWFPVAYSAWCGSLQKACRGWRLGKWALSLISPFPSAWLLFPVRLLGTQTSWWNLFPVLTLSLLSSSMVTEVHLVGWFWILELCPLSWTHSKG